jgi:hypothetical protein
MAKRIQVSEKVFAAIWALSEPGLTTESEILEQVLSDAGARRRKMRRRHPQRRKRRSAG